MELINNTIKKRRKSKADPVALESRKLKTPLPEKIIFLDIDGVLNNLQSDPLQLYIMEPELMKRLVRILEAVPRSAIVLSSTWRLTPTSRSKLMEFFKIGHLPTYISCTPNLATNRVDEILCWLQDNTDFDESGIQKIGLPTKLSKYDDELPLAEYLMPRLHITHFVAIDDMDLRKEPSTFTDYINPRFVHVSAKTGLTDANVKTAIELLGCG